jgi:diguanylate cyclase (GGDEF)-like protein
LLIANERFAVIMLDLDNFKSINDKYWHPKGDEVLEAFSKALRNSIRWNVDFAGRWGGEEFVLLLDLEWVKDWKSLLKEIISRIYINFQEELENIDNIRKIAFSWWVSMGEEVKSYKNPVDKILWIIDLADKRLYKAKRSWKAKVILPDWTEIKLWK